MKDLVATRCKQIQTMVGLKSKAYDWLVLNSKQEGLPLVGFKYQKVDDWLDSKFHCSYLESRGVPEKTREIRVKSVGKLYLFHFRFTTSGDVTSEHLISGDVTAPPQMLLELCWYTTHANHLWYRHTNVYTINTKYYNTINKHNMRLIISDPVLKTV